MDVSVLILTLNEELNLSACLESVRGFDDVVILDSFSSDQTEPIARDSGARFYQRKFDDFASQRNFALKEIEFRHPWVFHLDADERFTPKLFEEIRARIQNPDCDGYFVASQMIFMGRWLKHAGSYPAYQLRLIRLGKMEFIQHGHGQRESSRDRAGFLEEPMLHFSFEKGLADWLEKHNRYASAEARQSLSESEKKSGRISRILASDFLERRRALKTFSTRLPFRPFMKFMYLYFLRLGFLDLLPGFAYCVLQSFYEHLIVLKVEELRQRKDDA